MTETLPTSLLPTLPVTATLQPLVSVLLYVVDQVLPTAAGDRKRRLVCWPIDAYIPELIKGEAHAERRGCDNGGESASSRPSAFIETTAGSTAEELSHSARWLQGWFCLVD